MAKNEPSKGGPSTVATSKGATSKGGASKGDVSKSQTNNWSGKTLLEGLLKAFTAKDLPKVMSFFADDATFYDPHYPQQRMVGKAAIEQGMTWGMGSLEKPGFTVKHVWLDGNSGVAELDTHHVIKGGMKANFDQVFVFEWRDNKLTRLQSYVPYSPHGIAGVMGSVTRASWRLQGKMK